MSKRLSGVPTKWSFAIIRLRTSRIAVASLATITAGPKSSASTFGERLRAISSMVLPDHVISKPRAVQNALTSRDEMEVEVGALSA
ncbi:MAG: hypothetical protein IPN17_06700 [Deltaproteobacteria bacterium]|nr:hypothetical protein [Deltaproteobacteria bacterium]